MSDVTEEMKAAILADPRAPGVVAADLGLHHNTVKKVRKDAGLNADGTRGALTAEQMAPMQGSDTPVHAKAAPVVEATAPVAQPVNAAAAWAATPTAEAETQSARSAQSLRERRRRKTSGAESNNRLVWDRSKEDKDYEYRWFLDRPGRVEQAYRNDWDFVTDAHMDVGKTGNVTAVAGSNHYNANGMILMKKPKVLHQDDRSEKDALADQQEQSIRGGMQAEGENLMYKDPGTAKVNGAFVKQAVLTRGDQSAGR